MSNSLDIEKHDQLIAYLRDAGHIGRDETPTCSTLAGGVSNRTVLVQREWGEGWVIKQALAKLRVQVDWFSDPARVHREALALRWLPKITSPGTITPLVFEDKTRHLLAMQAVPQPHENWKTMLLRGEVDFELIDQFAALLKSIFVNSAGHPALRELFGDRTFFESLRIEPYYQHTASQVPEASAFLNELITQTRARALGLVHGDYSPKNVLVRDRRIVLLDHEVIHWGDPAFDIGFAMTHFLSKAHHLPAHREKFFEAARRFATGLPIDICGDAGVAHTLGCMLARVAGRSPLEYLDQHERDRQRRIIVGLMKSPPATVTDLMTAFRAALLSSPSAA